MEDKDTLLRQFFADTKQQIPDAGFTRRVMHNLPGKRRRAPRRLLLWDIVAYTLAALLFIALGGIQALGSAFARLLEQAAAHGHYDLRTVAIVAAVLVFLLCRKVCSIR